MNDEKKAMNCLNCYENKYRYYVETVPIDEKINETPTIKNLITGMDLTGIIATRMLLIHKKLFEALFYMAVKRF